MGHGDGHSSGKVGRAGTGSSKSPGQRSNTLTGSHGEGEYAAPRMVLSRRIWVGAATTALACALLVGSAVAERTHSERANAADRPAHKTRGRSGRRAKPARAVKPPPPAAPVEEADAPLFARLHSAWAFYRALADWQLRGQMDPSSYEVARRTLAVGVALASARPGAAIAAALTPEPSPL